jgi:hypothetical protein
MVGSIDVCSWATTAADVEGFVAAFVLARSHSSNGIGIVEYKGTSIDDIRVAAGFKSKASLYNHLLSSQTKA